MGLHELPAGESNRCRGLQCRNPVAALEADGIAGSLRSWLAKRRWRRRERPGRAFFLTQLLAFEPLPGRKPAHYRSCSTPWRTCRGLDVATNLIPRGISPDPFPRELLPPDLCPAEGPRPFREATLDTRLTYNPPKHSEQCRLCCYVQNAWDKTESLCDSVQHGDVSR